ncbi:MAG: outer membrane protein assembly factor BamD [Gammaproteobacteria bacterium]
MRRFFSSLAVAAVTAMVLAGCAHHGPRPIPPASVLYKHAQDNLMLENWKPAIAQLRQLLSTYPFGEYATQARLELIYANYRSNQPDEVAKQSDDFVQENPASPYVPYAMFMKGAAYANALQPGPLDSFFHTNLSRRDPIDDEQAFAAFKQLIVRYPDSPYAQRARQWMIFVRDRLANFSLGVARFYASRKQWVAAVDRASDVVTTFPATPAATPALKIMMQGYRALGEDQLAAAAETYYRYNFESPTAAAAAATSSH